MKAHELIEQLQKLVADHPKSANADVVLIIYGHDNTLQRDLRKTFYSSLYSKIQLEE
jgi:hypothetical protein